MVRLLLGSRPLSIGRSSEPVQDTLLERADLVSRIRAVDVLNNQCDDAAALLAKMHLEMELDMSKGLGIDVITKIRNYTGFSPIELLIVVAIMVCWPQTPVGYSRSAENEVTKQP